MAEQLYEYIDFGKLQTSFDEFDFETLDSYLDEQLSLDFDSSTYLDSKVEPTEKFAILVMDLLEEVPPKNTEFTLNLLNSFFSLRLPFLDFQQNTVIGLTKSLKRHIDNIEIQEAIRFYIEKGSVIPALWADIYFKEKCLNTHYELLSFEPFEITDLEYEFLDASEDSGLLRIYLETLTHQGFNSHIWTLVNEHLDGWITKTLNALKEGGDSDNLENLEEYAKFCILYIEYIKKGKDPSDDSIRAVLDLLGDVVSLLRDREYPLCYTNFYYKTILLNAFYCELTKHNHMSARAMCKLIEAKSAPGTKIKWWTTPVKFCEFFSHEERIWLAKRDLTVCLLELLCYRQDYGSKELRHHFINLLTASGRFGNDLSLFNITFDDEFYLYEPFNIDPKKPIQIGDIFRVAFYPLNHKAYVKAAFRSVGRWLKAKNEDQLDEEWLDAFGLNRLDPLRLLCFYDEIIDDVVNHERYGNIDVAGELTKAVHDVIEFDWIEISTPLLFFIAYFNLLPEHRIDFYQKVIERRGSYWFSALNSLCRLHIKEHSFELAQALIDTTPDGEVKDKLSEELSDAENKAVEFEKMFPTPEYEYEFEDITDTHLLYLMAACFASLSRRQNAIHHSSGLSTSFLVPYYHTSHSILAELINDELLIHHKESRAKLDVENITNYTRTSLPLIPNVAGYIDLESFCERLKREAQLRSFDGPAIEQAENKLKLGWLLNSFFYQVEDYGYKKDMVSFGIEEFMEIERLVSRFSGSQLNSVTFNAVNYVSGTQKKYKFSDEKACQRISSRLLKNLREFSPNNFAGKTFERNQHPSFGLETALFFVDGLSKEERYTKTQSQAIEFDLGF